MCHKKIVGEIHANYYRLCILSIPTSGRSENAEAIQTRKL